VWEGLPVGLVYVAYQLTACGLLFVVMLLAPDPTSSPLTNRGHALFGATIGVLTITLRMVMGLPEAAYWALVMANTLVPLINRVTRRRVFGT
jgi:electron transport complex protein RnfD